MSENNMPAVEAENMEMDASERQSYELAFHVLPTIAEGEVSATFEAIKAAIAKNGGELFGEEAPERFELAYEVEKHLEGKNKKFRSAYFGWVRFKAEPAAAVAINALIEANPDILRHLLIKLTKVEEENPFNFHEAVREHKMVNNIDTEEVTPDVEAEADSSDESEESSEETTDEPSEEKEV